MISSLSLAACGGGSAPGESTALSSSDRVVSLHGRVNVCPAAGTAKAKVSLPYGDGQGPSVTTNPDGTFSLDINTANVKGVNPVALTIESDNCQPENIFVENLASQGRDGSIATPEKNLQNLGPAEFVIPPPWRPLTHLGDDVYGGPANSNLQVATMGPSTVQPLGVLTQDMKDKYRTARVEFSARGMQTESLQCATLYKNQIGLSATTASSPDAVVRTVQPGASSGTGEFTRFSIPVDLADFPVGSTINFVASSGPCESGGKDIDDFELTSVLVRFEK